MAIKSFPNKAAYNAAVKPTIESQVSLIETSREIIVDGVNVLTTEPVPGDAIFLDESNKVVFVKGGDWIRKAIIPSAWTWVGTVFFREGRQVAIVHKTGADRKYADVVQFKLNDPTLDGAEHTASIGVRVSTNYNANTTISYTYTATALSQVVTALNAAIDAAKTSGGWTNTLWAYIADADGNKVEDDADATQIIVQFDAWSDYRQYQCAGMTHITWGDMPASTVCFKQTAIGGVGTDNGGAMNMARRIAYINSSSNTAAAPSANVPLGAAMVRRTEFNTSPYCQLLRDTYGTYEDYVAGDQMVMCPQKYGSFALPDGKTLTNKYALMSAPTKGGGTKYKFPAMNYAYTFSFGVQGLDFGDWFLPGVVEGTHLLRDETLAAITPTITKMAGTAINNSAYRWFAQRYGVYGARSFGGTYGALNYYYVANSVRAQAVALLNI